MRLQPFGASLSITSADRDALATVKAAASAALARYPVDGQLDLRVALHVSNGAPDASPGWPKVQTTRTPTGIEVACGGTTLVSNHRAGTAELRLSPCIADTSDAVRMFVEAAFWSPAIDGRHLMAVHSGLVVINGRGLLLRGQSGAGKSTLSYACVRRGAKLVSDDWVYAPAHVVPDTLWGYPWRMWMTTDAAARFTELGAIDPVAHPGADRIKVPVIPPVHQRRSRATVDAIVMIDPDRRLGVEPLEPLAARRRFDVSALDSELDSLPDEFVGRLLDRPCFTLRRGTDPNEAAGALAQLAGRLPARLNTSR